MTYLSKETSTQDGRPVELFKFVVGATTWRYCSGRVAHTYLGDTYAPGVIDRTAVQANTEFGRSELTLAVPYENPIAVLFTSGYPIDAINLTVYRTHTSDGEYITYWIGRVVSASFKGHTCELKCQPVFTSLQRAGLRALYQVQCRHALYGPGCGVDKSAFDVAGTIATISGTVITVAAAGALADDWFTAGYVAAAGGNRPIIAHAGTSLTLTSPLPGAIVGQAVTLYPGCNLTASICNSKFGNDLRYGGFRWIPKKNPFTGDAIV
jgi:uncharacterized phage protein (TIGR02218 family)